MLKNFFLKYGDFLFIAGSALVTRFWNLAYPARVVFDEAHFGLYASKYLSGTYYWDVHPPLGKLLFAVVGFFSGLDPNFSFTESALYPNEAYVWLRALTALFGVGLVLLVYFFAKKVSGSRPVAFLAAFLVIFDNAILVESRFILLDIILIFFILAALFSSFLALEARLFSRKWYLLLALTGLLGGIAMSIKWTGLAALGIVWLLIFIQRNKGAWSSLGAKTLFVSLVLLPTLLYVTTFTIHFSLVKTNCAADCGAIFETFKDLAEEDVSLPALPEGNIISKTIVENGRLFIANLIVDFEDIVGPHKDPWVSPWFAWPTMLKPVPYFVFELEGKSSSVYLLGNPFVWLAGLIGVFGYLFVFLRHAFGKLSMAPPYLFRLNMFMLGYMFYLFSFLFVRRPTFLYHYLFPLIISIFIFASLFDYFLSRTVRNKKKIQLIYAAVCILVFAGFVFFAPLSYGLPLAQEELNLRLWLPTWKYLGW